MIIKKNSNFFHEYHFLTHENDLSYFAESDAPHGVRLSYHMLKHYRQILELQSESLDFTDSDEIIQDVKPESPKHHHSKISKSTNKEKKRQQLKAYKAKQRLRRNSMRILLKDKEKPQNYQKKRDLYTFDPVFDKYFYTKRPKINNELESQKYPSHQENYQIEYERPSSDAEYDDDYDEINTTEVSDNSTCTEESLNYYPQYTRLSRHERSFNHKAEIVTPSKSKIAKQPLNYKTSRKKKDNSSHTVHKQSSDRYNDASPRRDRRYVEYE